MKGDPPLSWDRGWQIREDYNTKDPGPMKPGNSVEDKTPAIGSKARLFRGRCGTGKVADERR